MNSAHNRVQRPGEIYDHPRIGWYVVLRVEEELAGPVAYVFSSDHARRQHAYVSPDERFVGNVTNEESL